MDKEFDTILEEIRHTRNLSVNYDIQLPVKATSRQQMLLRMQEPGPYSMDPLHMFNLLKEKLRASDFFYNINKDKDIFVSRSEIQNLFKVTVIAKIVLCRTHNFKICSHIYVYIYIIAIYVLFKQPIALYNKRMQRLHS